MAAKTRLGEPSVRIAVIPTDEFKHLPPNGRVSRKQAKEILSWSVNAAAKTIQPEQLTCRNGLKAWKGEGLLQGVFVFPGDDGRCEFTNGSWLELNHEYGLLMDGDLTFDKSRH